MKYIDSLSEEERSVLDDLIRNAPAHRTRQRAHAIILSSKNYSINDLSIIFEVHRDTIARWLDIWEKKGLDGLFDAPKTGRPKIYGGNYQNN